MFSKQRSAKRSRLLLAAAAPVLAGAIAFSALVPALRAYAFTPDYNWNNLIDNPTFTDTSTMSASIIQTFLSNLHSGLAGYSDVEACSATIAAYYHHCGHRVSAAQIIYDSAHAYGINPRAILATLQKEQSLVTDPTPSSSQINCAMGYNSCSGYVGFFSQVDNGTWVLRYNYEGAMRHSTWLRWSPGANYPCSTAKTNFYSNGLYPGNVVTFTNAGGKSITVNIANSATASLYCYTPYVGPYSLTGYSGSYNFVYYFQLWFGSTQTSMQYAWSGVSQGIYTDSGHTRKFNRGGVHAALAPGATAYAQVTVRNNGYQTWTPSVAHLGTDKPHDRCSAFYSGWISCKRIGMAESSVVPGDTATFNFDIKAPATPGSYREYFSMVADGVTWMYGPGLYFDIDVVQPGSPASVTSTLNGGNLLLPGGSDLRSSGLHSIFTLQKDGNVVMYVDGKALWSTHTHGHSISKLAMQSDGNLVLYGTDGVPNWASGTDRNPGARLVIQPDGNAVIYNGSTPLWSSSTSGIPNNDSNYVFHFISSPAVLHPGQTMYTANRSYRLVFQSDGNVVIYSPTRALWSTGTSGKSSASLILQSDGNLVLYDSNGKVLWCSHTDHKGSSRLVMQADGNLVLYGPNGKPTWSTGTSGG